QRRNPPRRPDERTQPPAPVRGSSHSFLLGLRGDAQGSRDWLEAAWAGIRLHDARGPRRRQVCFKIRDAFDTIRLDVARATVGPVSAETSTPTRKRPDSGSGGGQGDAWRVIVLNDHHNTFEGVAFALAATLPGVTYEQGLRLADRIHNAGRSIVWSGHQELAELYWSQLESHGLTMAPLER